MLPANERLRVLGISNGQCGAVRLDEAIYRNSESDCAAFSNSVVNKTPETGDLPGYVQIE